MVFNINNTYGNNYVNHAVPSLTPEASGVECAQGGQVLAPTSPLWEAQKNTTGLTGKSSTTSNNVMGFCEAEDTILSSEK